MYFLRLLEAGNPRSRYWHVWFLLRPFFMACRWLPSYYALTWGFLFVCAAQPFTDKDVSHNSLGLHLIITFNLHYLFKGSVSSYSHTGWLELQHMNWRGLIQLKTLCLLKLQNSCSSHLQYTSISILTAPKVLIRLSNSFKIRVLSRYHQNPGMGEI